MNTCTTVHCCMSCLNTVIVTLREVTTGLQRGLESVEDSLASGKKRMEQQIGELRRMNKDLLVQSQDIPKVDETGVDLARIVSNTTAEMDLETKESFALDQQKVAEFERSVEGLKKRQQDLFDLETAKVKTFADEAKASAKNATKTKRAEQRQVTESARTYVLSRQVQKMVISVGS